MPTYKAKVHQAAEEQATSLELVDAGVKQLSEDLCGLDLLEHLSVAHNSIEGNFLLHDTIFDRVLHMRWIEIPDHVIGLQSLKFFNAFNNKIKTISPRLLDLKALQYLIISNNKLKEVPIGIGALPCLTVLDLSYNSIRELRPNIGYLGNTTFLFSSINSFTD